MSMKSKAWKACSKYIRLRDALAYCGRMRIDISQFNRVEDLPVKCCTCETVKSWVNMDAGHFICRGLGGMSGVYFDERNINTQCKVDNAFHQGKPMEYYQFMLEKYGLDVIEELRIKHSRGHKYGEVELMALEQYYKGAFEGLKMNL